MKKEMVSACAGCVPKGSTFESLRSGMAKDKLIFIIICSVATGVAVITMASFLFSGSTLVQGPNQWQCLVCDYIFEEKTSESPPIDCPKGHPGQAVALNYRNCPECGEKIAVFRWRLTEAGKAQEGAGGFGGPLTGMGSPMAVQYRAQQSDGSYGWTDWISSRDPRTRMIQSTLTCEKCGALLYPSRPRRSSRGDR